MKPKPSGTKLVFKRLKQHPMFKLRICTLAILLLLGFGCSSSKSSSSTAASKKSSKNYQSVSYNDNTSDIAAAIGAMINDYRVKKGLPKFAFSDKIAVVATKHSENMAKGKVGFGHSGFNQRFEELKASLARIGSGAENVAYGKNTPLQKIVQGWLESPGHKKNIEGDYNLTGIGVYRSAKGTVYYTQLFLKQSTK